MKKALIMICTAVMTLSLTACAGRVAEQTSEPTQNRQAAASSGAPVSSAKGSEKAGQAKLLSAGYLDIMKSGKFLIRYRAAATADGVTTEAEVTTATDGKNVETVMKTQEMTDHMIIKDNVLYILDDENKIYSKLDVSQQDNTVETGNLIDTQGLIYTRSGTGTISGKTLPYEEYGAADETLRFYMDGKGLYAITSRIGKDETTMVILELTGEIPGGMFSIPAGYKEGTVMSAPGSIDMAGDEQTQAQ